MHGPTAFELTAEMRRQYNDDGYFATPVLFDAERVRTVRDEMLRVWACEIAEAEQASDAYVIQAMRHRPFIGDIARKSQVCADFLRHPILLDLARQMIGPDADVPAPQAVIKPTNSREVSNSFAWHQDNYYAGHGAFVKHWDRSRLLDIHNGYMCWVALTRTTVANGTLWVVPGKHREGFLPHERDEQRKEWVCQFDDSAKHPVELEPGQMLVFSGLTPHSSGPNTTPQTRVAYQFGFVRPGTTTVPSIVPVMRNGAALAPGL